jgi:hypothetical protein
MLLINPLTGWGVINQGIDCREKIPQFVYSQLSFESCSIKTYSSYPVSQYTFDFIFPHLRNVIPSGCSYIPVLFALFIHFTTTRTIFISAVLTAYPYAFLYFFKFALIHRFFLGTCTNICVQYLYSIYCTYLHVFSFFTSSVFHSQSQSVSYTDKKENQIFLINKKIQSGAVAKSYTV